MCEAVPLLFFVSVRGVQPWERGSTVAPPHIPRFGVFAEAELPGNAIIAEYGGELMTDAAEEKPARRLPRAFHAAARQPSKEQKGNGRVEEEAKCCEL